MIDNIRFKSNRNFMTTRKRKGKIDVSAKSSFTLTKLKENQSANQSCITGMEYWLFKREVNEDETLIRFLKTHKLEGTQYNIKTIREFADNSIESPIDFKSIIRRLQK